MKKNTNLRIISGKFKNRRIPVINEKKLRPTTNQIKETLARMNDVLMCIIERSQLEKPVQCFVDAPLLLDVEIEFDLSGKLTKIKSEICDGYPFNIFFIIIPSILYIP